MDFVFKKNGKRVDDELNVFGSLLFVSLCQSLFYVDLDVDELCLLPVVVFFQAKANRLRIRPSVFVVISMSWLRKCIL